MNTLTTLTVDTDNATRSSIDISFESAQFANMKKISF